MKVAKLAYSAGPTMTDYRIAIFGAGSVGLCLAAHFALVGASVSLLVRKASVPSLQARALKVTGLLGDHTTVAGDITLCDAVEPTDTVFKADMLVMTTKAYDLAEALMPFADRRPCPPVLLMQNGMGAADVARDLLGPTVPVYSTAIWTGMERRLPNHVEVTAHASPILCGATLDDDVGPLQKMLRVAERGFIPMVHDETIRDSIAFKLLFNACMNPTGALTGRTYGELLEDAASRALITDLADETLSAYSAAFNYRPAENGRHYVEEVLHPMIFPKGAGHRSSMLQDLQTGRRTEIEFLNGAVVRLAKQVGLSAKSHKDIIARVRKYEEKAV